ncbi:DinB family protein [Cellulosimicrobium arenosum]|uniref:DinB family protein n=1 Tax=Cellulosimicrobium arenosum TaxID=2708133 RepID=A0A927G9I5_9MICO|nr:DinB family protein [Cellulosimicrobium arenosum]MBD8078840.1 DinB family protein [Cellulosimicrobium arenosum]
MSDDPTTGDATTTEDQRKAILLRYLDRERAALLAKADGLGEYDVRRPLTGTGTNLLGLLKHVASVQIGYFGEVFGRPHDVPVPWFEQDAEVNADMWATPEESRAEILELWRRSCEHSDETIAALDLDARGEVPWWSPERREVTLFQILVHMLDEMAHHAGHADIVREQIDGAAGDDRGNLPNQSPTEWASYRARVEAAAREAAATPPP